MVEQSKKQKKKKFSFSDTEIILIRSMPWIIYKSKLFNSQVSQDQEKLNKSSGFYFLKKH